MIRVQYPQRTYRGHRLRDGTCRITCDGRKLDLRLDLFNHSPTGFEWGYGGSGPAQTALAILADYLGNDELAVRLHQKFKWEKITPLPHKSWSINEAAMKAWFVKSRGRRSDDLET